MELITLADHRRIARITAELAAPSERQLLDRRDLAEHLLQLFRADFLGTTHFNRASRQYENPKCYNREDSMSLEYFQYFQFVDPVSAVHRRFRTPRPTYAAMPREAFRRTEYYNDYLRRYRVEEGMDLYLNEGRELLGDFRVWRGPRRPPLGEREAMLLSALKPWLVLAMRLEAEATSQAIDRSKDRVNSDGQKRFLATSAPALSAREREVLKGIMAGHSDKEIARRLGMSFWTVRTHLAHLRVKTGERNRVGLATWALEQRRSESVDEVGTGADAT